MLIFCADPISAVHCHECEPMKLDYIVTADNLPPLDNCSVVTTERYCLAAIIWLLNGTSEVLYYPINANLTFERVNVLIGRNASGVAQYTGERLIDYRCSSSDIPCNTPENLKRALTATTFPSDDQVNQLNTLIVVAPFDNASCLISSNATRCPPVDLDNCQRCEVSVDYLTSQMCATCPKGSSNDVNFFDHRTTYVLNNRTISFDRVTLECQAADQCNSLANVERIRQMTIIKFDFDKFFSSDATTPQFILVMMITALLHFVPFGFEM